MIAIGFGFDFFDELILLAGEFAGFGAHLAHVFGELVGIFATHLIAQLLELAFSASSGSERLRWGSLLGGFRRALHILPRSIQLLAFLLHARLVLRLVHALAQFIDIREHLLFFFLQSFELAADFFALLFRAGFLQSGLQFAQAII